MATPRELSHITVGLLIAGKSIVDKYVVDDITRTLEREVKRFVTGRYVRILTKTYFEPNVNGEIVEIVGIAALIEDVDLGATDIAECTTGVMKRLSTMCDIMNFRIEHPGHELLATLPGYFPCLECASEQYDPMNTSRRAQLRPYLKPLGLAA